MNQALVEVDVLHAQFAAFGDTETAAVDEGRHQPGRSLHRREESRHFRHAQDNGQVYSAARANRRCQPVEFEAEHFPAEKQERAERLVLCAGRHVLSHGEVGQVIANDSRVDSWVGMMLPLGCVAEKALNPADVGAFRAVRVMTGAHSRPELFERSERIDAIRVGDDAVCGLPMPDGSAEEVDEVDPDRVFGLAHLPVFTAARSLEFLTEPACLVGERSLGGGR